MSKQKKIVNVQRVKRRLVKTTTRRERTVEEEAEEAANATVMAREDAQARTMAHLVSLTAKDFPSVTSAAGLRTLRMMDVALPGQSGSSELRTAIARDEYAKSKVAEIASYDEKTALNYDPATDTEWP